MKLLNCRDMACPQPVIRSRELVDAGTAELEVLVDNEPAAENVERFLRGRGYAVDRAREGDGLWRLTARAGEGTAVGANPVRAETASGLGREAGTLVLITTESLGRGDEGLGEKLMIRPNGSSRRRRELTVHTARFKRVRNQCLSGLHQRS